MSSFSVDCGSLATVVRLLLLGLLGVKTATTVVSAPVPARCSMWVDAIRGEPVELVEMLDDLQHAGIVYLGEYHSIPRHHVLERELFAELIKREARLVLAMEQFEAPQQAALDRFNAGKLDLPGLVERTELARRWPGYTNYVSLLELAQQHHVPVLALNAPEKVIRQVGRAGLEKLPPDLRRQLPLDIATNDPPYHTLLLRTLAVHMAFNPERLEPIFQAQVARDETMASRLVEYLQSPPGKGRIAVVICGQGHCQFGLGTPTRVQRRLPGVVQRIVLFSESGDLHLTPEERKEAREVEISHQFLRDLGRAPADYLNVLGLAP